MQLEFINSADLDQRRLCNWELLHNNKIVCRMPTRQLTSSVKNFWMGKKISIWKSKRKGISFITHIRTSECGKVMTDVEHDPLNDYSNYVTHWNPMTSHLKPGDSTLFKSFSNSKLKKGFQKFNFSIGLCRGVKKITKNFGFSLHCVLNERIPPTMTGKN
jgi:hypothetical protein